MPDRDREQNNISLYGFVFLFFFVVVAEAALVIITCCPVVLEKRELVCERGGQVVTINESGRSVSLTRGR